MPTDTPYRERIVVSDYKFYNGITLNNRQAWTVMPQYRHFLMDTDLNEASTLLAFIPPKDYDVLQSYWEAMWYKLTPEESISGILMFDRKGNSTGVILKRFNDDGDTGLLWTRCWATHAKVRQGFEDVVEANRFLTQERTK